MTHRILLTLGLTATLAAFGCDRDHDHAHDHGENGHAHEDGQTDTAEHGDEHDLGSVGVGGYTVKAVTFGPLQAGQEGHVTVTVTGGDAPPAAVRVWTGVESGEGSVKKLFELSKTDAGWQKHEHIEVPDPLPAGSKLWVELETVDGNTHTGSFAVE